MKKHLRIADALIDLQNDLDEAYALNTIVWDKAHYLVSLCEDAGVSLERARADVQALRKALEPQLPLRYRTGGDGVSQT